jgi:hypothetical protein
MRRTSVLALAYQTTPRYCDHCGSMNLWEPERHTVTGVDSDQFSGKLPSAMPAWECAVCWSVTVLTTRATKRLRALDRKPKFHYRFRKDAIDTRKLVG